MSQRKSKPWWWAATVPAIATMIAASSSIMVHAYRPLSVYSAERSAPNKPVTFDFRYNIDNEQYHRAATVKLDSISQIERSEFDEGHQEALTWDPPELNENTETFKATVLWQANPETPLDGCHVRLSNAEGLEHPVSFALSPQERADEIDLYSFSTCEPRGAFGPTAIDPFDLKSHILPEPSPRPNEWEMTFYFMTNKGFQPKELVITWNGPYEVRLVSDS